MSIKESIQEYATLSNSVADIDGQIAQLQMEKADMESRMAEIKAALKREMIDSGRRTATIAGWKLNLSTSTSTVIEEADMLPEEFWKIERKPDVMKIKEQLKIGLHVAGAVLKTNKNLSLKPIDREIFSIA
jgi:hypothetical protein